LKKIDEVAVVVQARMSSQRCPGKMARPFANSTLIDVTIEKIKESKIIPTENFYLSVHEPELVEIGIKNKVNIFHRSKESALWDGGPDAHLTGMYEWWNKIPFKYVVLVSACTPLLEVETIDGFFQHYLQTDSDGLFAVMEKMNYFWDGDGNLLTPLRNAAMNTKNVQITKEAAHCLYASRLSSIGDGVWMGDFSKKGEIELYSVPEEECYDVDYEWQFPLVEAVYKQKNNIDV
tara:strand:- start:1301 stop:2002 length:702 start_codon:yes stop_codon:yes gene_type:complete